MNTYTRSRLPKFKFCCDGQNAVLITPIKTIQKESIRWRRGLYHCKKCNEYSIRGETSQKSSFNTQAELITKDQAESILKEKENFLRYKNEQKQLAFQIKRNL